MDCFTLYHRAFCHKTSIFIDLIINSNGGLQPASHFCFKRPLESRLPRLIVFILRSTLRPQAASNLTSPTD